MKARTAGALGLGRLDAEGELESELTTHLRERVEAGITALTERSVHVTRLMPVSE